MVILSRFITHDKLATSFNPRHIPRWVYQTTEILKRFIKIM
jgi:hypothetical protein